LLDFFQVFVNTYKENQRDLNIWAGESHDIPQGNYLAINLNTEIKFKNFIIESIDAKVGPRPEKNPAIIRIRYGFNGIHEAMQKAYPIPRYKRKMPCRINIFKWIIAHINIQIQASNRPCCYLAP
jgi:hypothetical protein